MIFKTAFSQFILRITHKQGTSKPCHEVVFVEFDSSVVRVQNVQILHAFRWMLHRPYSRASNGRVHMGNSRVRSVQLFCRISIWMHAVSTLFRPSLWRVELHKKPLMTGFTGSLFMFNTQNKLFWSCFEYYQGQAFDWLIYLETCVGVNKHHSCNSIPDPRFSIWTYPMSVDY